MSSGDPDAVVMMGVSGSGKTTIARLVAERLGWTFGEADELQPPVNVAKLRAGMPLTDLDRVPWLVAVRDWIRAAGGPVTVSCSALRRSYRDILRAPDLDVRFVRLDGELDLIWPRLESRPGPFMSVTMLESQFRALEPLQPDETGMTVPVDGSPDDVADRVISGLGLTSTGPA